MLVAHPQQHTFSSASAGVVDVGSALLPNTHTPAITHAIPTRQILLELQQQSSASGYPEVKSSTSSLPDPIPPTGEHPSVHNNAAVGTLPAADDTKAATGAASAPIVPPATHPPPGKAAALAARMSSKAAKRASLRSPLDVSAVLIPSAEVINDPSTGRTSHAVSPMFCLFGAPFNSRPFCCPLRSADVGPSARVCGRFMTCTCSRVGVAMTG